MELMSFLIELIELIVILYFGFASIYIFIFAIAGLFYKDDVNTLNRNYRKTAVLIPGYKEDAVIIEVAKSALSQNYPKIYFDVVVIADSFRLETINELKKLPIKLIEVSFEKSTKAKALNSALEVLSDDYETALVLDADNIMEPDFINKINAAFSTSSKVVQGHRVAKNLNTKFAVLDAISEEVNNNIFRKGHRQLGLSASLIGSAMAFEYNFFKSVMSNVTAIGGFDKELEFKLIKDGIRLQYLNSAYVYDEKIQRSEDFQNQRRRWLSAQFVYLRQYFIPGVKDFFLHGNIDFLDKVYQMLTPPRILLLGVSFFMTFMYGFLEIMKDDLNNSISSKHWLLVLIFTVLALGFSIPKKFYKASTLSAILSLPKAFLLMFLMLFKLKGANKKFIHTEHGTIKN